MIIKPTKIEHRNTLILNIVLLDSDGVLYDGFDRVVAQLESDGLWWIIPSWSSEESCCADIGPFDNAEDAVLTMRLTMVITT